MDENRKEQWVGDLLTIEQDILPDLRNGLTWLTRPDYKPEENPDDEYRAQDIEHLKAEIRDNEKRVAYLRKKLGIT
jgi:hypothetical protein